MRTRTRSIRFDMPAVCDLYRHLGHPEGGPLSILEDIDPEALLTLPPDVLTAAAREARSARRQLGTRALALNPDYDHWLSTIDAACKLAREAQPHPRESQAALCASCGRRPRRFDDLCGRCAEEAGTRPHGRV